jgi:phosphohistidine swiveling domain-containing protein
MSITELDELQHPASDDGLWRESLYFNFHDASGKIAGTTTVGIRPHQNRVNGLAAIFLNPQQTLRYGVDCPLDAQNAGLYTVGGISYKILTPLEKWRVMVKADFTGVDPCQTSQGNQAGITAMVGVQEATPWVRDGQRVPMDGAAGTREVIE